MFKDDENELPYLVEYPLPDGIDHKFVTRLAELVIGGPIFLRRDTKTVAAIVDNIIIKPNMLLCELVFLDKELEQNMADLEWVMVNYIDIDPIYSLLGPEN